MTVISVSSGFQSQKKRKRLEKLEKRKHRKIDSKQPSFHSKRSGEHRSEKARSKNTAWRDDKTEPDIFGDEDGTLIRISPELIKNIKSGKVKEDDMEDDPDDAIIRKMEKLLKINKNRKKNEEMEKEASSKLTLKDYIAEKRKKKELEANLSSSSSSKKNRFMDDESDEGEESDASDYSDNSDSHHDSKDSNLEFADDEEELVEDEELMHELQYYDALDDFLTSNLDANEEDEEEIMSRLSVPSSTEASSSLTSKTVRLLPHLDSDHADEEEKNRVELDALSNDATNDMQEEVEEDEADLKYYDDLDAFLTGNLDADEEEEEEMLSRISGGPIQESSPGGKNQKKGPLSRNPTDSQQTVDKDSSDDENLSNDENDYYSDSQSEESSVEDRSKPSASSGGKYIPPHLRKKSLPIHDASHSEEYLHMEKELRSICNKLSHTNIVPLTMETLKIYKENPKTIFNSVLSDIIIQSLTDDVKMLGEFIVVYAGLVICLHNIADMEVGARFMETLVHRYEEELKSSNTKSVLNMTLFFGHLFNMSLFTKEFLYDMIEKLIEHAESGDNGDFELIVESVYKLLLSCSILLKKNDPSVFRRVIKNVVDKLESHAKAHTLFSMKVKTFLELISTVHAQTKREEQQEEFTKYQLLRKAIYQLQQKAGVHGDMTLSMLYSDLRDSFVKGRWWIVGTAWKGHDSQSTVRGNVANSLTEAGKAQDKAMAKLRKLAIKQKMTTELRIEIFCAIMSASKLEEAVKNLQALNIITNNREIVRVIIHCSCQERQFNIYYTNLLEALCEYKNFNRAIQFVFYERFKDLNTYEMRHVSNMCFMLSHLFGKEVLKLAILKTIDFSTLKGKSLIFFRFLFVNLFLDYDEQTLGMIFFTLAKQPNLSEVKESIRLFLVSFRERETRRKFLPDFIALRDISKKDDEEFYLLQEEKIKKCTKKMMRVLSFEPNLFDDDAK